MIEPKILKRKYDSGFEAQLILKPGFNQRFFGIIVDFGSSDPQEVPGLAHFLEHKLFAKKEGDISQNFEELGAEVNAFTSFNETMYYCSGVDHNSKLIELLFKLVGEPYFTKQNVEQEVPIIEQELAMYQDEPNWAITNALMTQMFGESNLGIDVAGTKASINQIDKKKLLAAYQTNYKPNKMHFVACGDFSENQIKTIFRLVGKLQKQYLTNSKQKKAEYQETVGLLQDIEITSDGSSNQFGLGIRLKNFKKVLASLDLAQIILEIMLESKLSVMSPWFERMKEEQLLNSPLQISVNYTREGNFITLYGVSSESDKVITAIKEELAKPITEGNKAFEKNFFELQKREWLAQSIRSMNNLSYLAVEAAEASLDNEDTFVNVEKLQDMNFSQFEEFCSNLLKDCQICSARLVKG
ncbi:EF-P 5-aminopentanol modification-associated protein YfmH [Lactobacillus kalixensis]|uniref:Protease n=1 Tax=Lactobacillus kalixensis DSM 16043 TaxID=1423763 RepID=A0A0R1UDW9_9LACO|nr:pitrilysin family protein [Lactobacillus kalixensis]KRL91581.1 protease [Lactobacillus kalixensis DSM 16043]